VPGIGHPHAEAADVSGGDLDPRTVAAHAGWEPRRGTGDVVPPIHPSTTFVRDEDYELVGPHVYSRNSHANGEDVERLAARLDQGAAALVFASGMAGIAAVFDTLRPGAHVAAPRIMYHGTVSLLRRLEADGRISLTLFDATAHGALESSLQPGATELVWIESPANPTWDVIDIARAAAAAHEAGAVLAVDSTVAPPVTTRPLTIGADLVFHSATKYYNGHSDVLAGIVVSAHRDARWEEIHTSRTLGGSVLGPFEAWLLLRGMRTMPLRYERASANALALARRFSGDPRLEGVLYPGLPDHPGHETAASQMTGGFGGMLSLLAVGGGEEAARIASSTTVFRPATSLGGVESLIEHRAAVEGPGSVVPANLLRLSVGIEAEADLIADLDQALGQEGAR
jgi:cystathionine gamma-synthase